MKPLWRVLRIAWSLLTHTAYLAFTVRRLPPGERAAYRAHRQQVGCRLLCRMVGVHVETVGVVPSEGATLAVCNHFGVLDPIVLASQFPVSFVGKADLQRWPFLGWVTREMGLIFVERQRRTQTAAFVEEVQQRQRDGVLVLVFPEGTTSRDETLLPFKTGAFAAVEGTAGATVLPLYLAPVAVEGEPAVGPVRRRITWADNSQTFVRHVWQLMHLKSVHMQVRVGSPVDAGDLNRKELARLLQERVRELGALQPKVI